MRKAKVIKKGGKSMKRIFVLLVVLGIITALAPAANAAVLWVAPENPDEFDTSSETVIDNAIMGTSFSGNVSVLNHASSQSSNVAQDVFLKFFVNDGSNIVYIYAENNLTGRERVKTAYSHDGGYTHVPEFTTIAIPVAAILGLLFFFNHRKRKKS